MFVLAFFSIVGGWVSIPIISGGDVFGNFLVSVLNPIVSSETHHSFKKELVLMFLSLVISILGFFLAYQICYKKKQFFSDSLGIGARLHSLLLNKYFVDEIYNLILVRPLRYVAKLFFKFFEQDIIEASVNGTGRLVKSIGSNLRSLQDGYVKTYAVSILFGAVCIIMLLVSNFLSKF